MYFGKNRMGERSSIHSEAQIRFWKLAHDYNQLVLRVGYNWEFSRDNMASGGYAFIDTDPFSNGVEGESTEHRLWQQYIRRATAGRVDFEHRFRLEQRWIDRGGDIDFEGRIRYRILLSIDLAEPDRSRSYLALYDEIFINLQGEGFDQNRLYSAYGYRIDVRSRLEVGLLWNAFSAENLWRLQLAYFYNP